MLLFERMEVNKSEGSLAFAGAGAYFLPPQAGSKDRGTWQCQMQSAPRRKCCRQFRLEPWGTDITENHWLSLASGSIGPFFQVPRRFPGHFMPHRIWPESNLDEKRILNINVSTSHVSTATC